MATSTTIIVENPTTKLDRHGKKGIVIAFWMIFIQITILLILSTLAAPFILGSWWSLVPAGMIAVLVVIRTALEDRTLQQELAGYAEYTTNTRYRLVPFVW